MSERHARFGKLRSVLVPPRMPHRRSVAARPLAKTPRSLQPESLEERMLLAVGPQLISVQPNSGDVLSNGVVRNVAPQQLTFVFDQAQQIDPDSLDGIRVTRAGFDNTFDGVTDVLVAPGYVGVDEDRPNQVVLRFADALPDDLYRIQIFAVDDAGRGIEALRNTDGQPFRPATPGADRTVINFELNLGAQVQAVVPRPITRNADGSLSQARDKIEVYFNDDNLSPTAATNPAFYSLIYSNGTVHNTDDTIINPVSVTYDPTADKAVLTFASDLDSLATGTGTYRLRIGTDEGLPGQPGFDSGFEDPGSSFDTAYDIGTLSGAQILSAGIDPIDYPVIFPGGLTEPGHREINEVETHLLAGADEEPGISTVSYNFKNVYGFDPNGNPLFNLITDEQKDRAREIFEIYSYYLGVQFVETAEDGLTIVTGDMRAIDPTIDIGPGGTIGLAGDASPDPMVPWPTAIMDNSELWDDQYGETVDLGRLSWFDTAMHEIGHLLNFGHTYDLPPQTIMGSEPEQAFNTIPEPVFPGDHDIVHGQYLHRPESNDIDLFEFRLETPGEFTAEIIAERQEESSQLDSVISLYRNTPDGPELIARNDDYFSEDSFVGLNLEAGTYFLAVTSTGNTAFDPTIEDTGYGGTSQGVYDLRLDFKPRVDNFLVDATGVALDGNADGVPGGEFNFWFQVDDESRTLYVDKAAPSGGDGTLGAPFNNLRSAVTAAETQLSGGGIIRVVGNGGADGDMGTLGDNLAYEIGINEGRSLADGQTLRLPKDVTMMVDAGAVFKMLKSNIQVGSSSVTINRSGSALQILGIPGRRVVFTSYDDQSIGVDTNPRQTTPDPGDWGGIIFQNDVDRAEGRFDYEQIGAFLNTVNQADIRYGGGNVTLDSIQQVINPVHMVDARPTVSYNRITFSADAALSANPDSFEETNYNAPDSLGIDYQATPYTSDYDRIGPDLRGNRLLENSINGLFIRIETPAGDQLETMTVTGRWDDTDLVHVVAENLVIESTPGGPTLDPLTGSVKARTDAQLKIDPSIVVKLDGARIEVQIGAQLLSEGVDGQRVILTSLLDDRFGAAGTFRTSTPSDGVVDPPAAGDWSGIYIAPTARASIDHAFIAYAGGISRVEGSFAQFNAIEVHQSDLRLTNTTLADLANGRGGQADVTREGRARNGEGAIFVRGAQPIIVNNIIKRLDGFQAGVINIDVNSLNYELIDDVGRATGPIDRITRFTDNQGPLIRLNRLADNRINGMVIRGGTLTTEGVWDDTDIVHVVYDEIVVPNFHTYGGLRLESSASESLVVKFAGPDAAVRATGTPLDIDDRIGGMLHIIGQPGHPVVMTALADDTVGAGFDPIGRPQTDTDGFIRELPQELPGSFQIEVNYGPLIRELPQYVAAIELAVQFWERWVEDPIEVVLDMEIDPSLQSSGTLGAASAEFATIDWDVARQAMIDDGRSHELDLLSALPLFDQTNFTLPVDPSNPFSVNRNLSITRANALALGIDPALLPQIQSQYDPTEVRDGSIVFAPNPWDIANDGTPSFFDFDRNDTVTPDFSDFTGVVIHEIGHALGFISGVDDVDAALNNPNSFRDISFNTLDMFRLEPGDGSVDFTNAARAFDPALDQVFYDGGFFDPYGINVISGLRLGDIPFSTGSDNGDGSQASHWKDLGMTLGLMDPTAPPNEAWMSDVDRFAFDLIGWDVVGGPVAGDWRGVRLEQYSQDRNVAMVTELEDPTLPAPGENSLPETAEVLGQLGRGENNSDENLRLGFVVHGSVSEPSDIDVYSFEARGGTEVWFDIDNSSAKLDSVIELIDANGVVLARTDNSYAEGLGNEEPFAAEGLFVSGLQKSLTYDQDHGSTNLKDAGMRLVLPGAPSQLNTYHVRVRSSSDDVNVISAGKTSGVYELQIRLSEVDEYPGSTVQFADIRYAMDGIRINGLPTHSPLVAEVSEQVFDWLGIPIDRNDEAPLGISLDGAIAAAGNSRVLVRPTVGPISGDALLPSAYNDSFQEAQFIGNVMQSDRAAISISGLFDDTFRPSGTSTDASDMYLFEVRFASTQQPGGNSAELTFDLDYSDGLARSNPAFAIYSIIFESASGESMPEVKIDELIYHSLDGGGPDDHPAPLQGTDLDDLSRGSVGLGDPYIGPVSLDEGYYILQVINPAIIQYERLQYEQKLPPNPYARFEPIDSIARIAEDRIGEPITEDGQGTTFSPPQVPLLLDPAKAPVPFNLGDVELFVSTGSSISSVDPFMGGVEVNYGALIGVDGADGFFPIIGDFALRDNPLFDPTSTDPNAARTQRLMAFANDLGTGNPPTDATVGGYLFLDIAEETAAERLTSNVPAGSVAVRGVGPAGALTDDTIATFMADPDSEDPAMPDIIPADIGLAYDALAFNPTSRDIGEGFAIAHRSDGVSNILLRFDAATGQAISATGDVQDDAERLPVPNPIPTPAPPVPMRQPNAGFDIVEQGVLDTEAGGGPGGDITGLVFMGATLYGVSDEGGLYSIGTGPGAQARYIATIFEPTDDPSEEPEPIGFEGLTLGPQDVEDGLYADLLFGIDNRGELYAFNTDGELQPIFNEGALSVSTGVRGATGLDFGTLDENLWHVTPNRGGDAGHGRLFPTPQFGGLSFYFGEAMNPGGGDARNYDFLGGARGSMVTEPFSLAGYDPSHDPYIYFTYFLATEEAYDDPLNFTARDSFRVFVADDDRDDGRGQWHLVASNQPGETGPGALDVDPMDDIFVNVQPLWDNSWQDVPFVQSANPGRNGQRDPFPYQDDNNLRPFDPANHDWQEFAPVLDETGGVWRQARIDIRDFAGSDSLRIRFDFSSAGSFDVGRTGGTELRAIEGSRIDDGMIFVVDGQNFEFDAGYTLVAPGGRSLVDGETFTLTDDTGASITFEMDGDGQANPANVAIAYAENDSSRTIATLIEEAILADFPSVVPHVNDNRINLENAVDLQFGVAGGLQVVGAPGVTDGNTAVVIHSGMTSDEVAEAMVQPLADVFAGGLTDVIKQSRNVVKLFGLRISDPGPLGLTAALPGDVFGNFNNPLRAKNTPENGGGRNDQRFYDLGDDEFNFAVPFEGVYVDDLIVGFASFGEAGADLRPDYPHEPQQGYETIPDVFEGEQGGFAIYTPPPLGEVLTGEYQVEIRRASDYASGPIPNRTFDPRDRLSQSISLVIPPPVDLYDGQTFFVSDGVNTFGFEFDDQDLGNGVADDRVPIPYTTIETRQVVMERVRDAINSLFLADDLEITAAGSNGAAVGSVATSERLNLFGTVVNVTGDIEVLLFDESGAENRFRDQGQLVIASNTITHSALYGVVVEDAYRDMPCKTANPTELAPGFCNGLNFFDVGDNIDHSQGTAADYNPSYGAPRNTREVNQDALAPSVVIANNVVAFGGQGGIHFSGDPSGHIVIAPVGGPQGVSEVWDDANVHFLLQIVDNNGDSAVFEFRAGGAPPLGLTDYTIDWNPTGDCPAIHGVQNCVPRFSPQNPDMAEAILVAIGESHLDIKPYRSRPDELYLEGAAVIRSAVVQGDATSVTFGGDVWFYPFNILPPQSAVPFGRIVNNTIVGNGGTLAGNNLYNAGDFNDVGILIEDYADPTLLNNVIVNFEHGIRTDQTSTTPIIGGTLYQGNVDNAVNVPIGDFAIELGPNAPLFVDREAGNFYPADLSRIIDSSVDSLEDRPELVTVKQPLGISRSPIIAPDFDVLGQLRIDDPRVEPPEGFGKNVFKDRGAIDRVDFLGPIAQFLVPVDNDVAGVDKNPATDRVRIEGTTQSVFVVQLADLGEATAPTGTGIDDTTVTASSVILRRDGEVLVEGVDYRFDYQATTNQILLTPQAGVWLAGFTYEIELVNQSRYVVTTGDSVADGDVFRVTDPDGRTRSFEIETGYSLEVPQTLTIVVPEGTSGLSAVADSEIFTISNGVRIVTFEFDSNNSIGTGRVRVPFQPSSTPNEVADSIVAAIESASLGLAPKNLGDGLVHIGGPINTIVDTAVTALQQIGQPGVFVDGQTMLIRDTAAAQTVRFEFDDDNSVTGNNVPITFDSNWTRQELATAVVNAINGTALPIDAVLGREGIVNLGSRATLSVNPESSSLALLGQPGLQQPGATPIAFRPTEDIGQREISEMMQMAVEASALEGIYTLIDEAGRLVVLGADNVQGFDTQFTPPIRDIAGNLLRTNQDDPPFETLLVVDLPAPLDFGDAPDPTYATLLASNGARHVVVPNIRLGSTNSAELDGQIGVGDDSDNGVTLLDVLTPGGSTPVRIVASTEGFIDAWIDVDADGTFDTERDQVLDSVRVARGTNTLRLSIPEDATLGETWARFRFSTRGGLAPTGRASDGEVEDYPVSLVFVDPPTAGDDSYAVDEDDVLIVGASTGVLSNDNDPNGGDLTAVVVDPPANGSLTMNADGSFVYTPDPDYFGTDTFTYRARTEILGSNLATVTIAVASQPDEPVAGDDSATTPEDTPVTIDLVANDVDPDGALDRTSIVIISGPSNGTVEVDDNGMATYTPAANYFGTDSFQYTIQDGEGATSAPATVTIQVTSVNDPPVANNDEMFVRQGTPVTYDLLANDTDIDGTLNRQSIVIVRSPKSGEILFLPSGSIRFTPDVNFLGIDTFAYTVRDNSGATSNTATVTVTVSGDNFAPVAQDDQATTGVGESVVINLVANDSDPDDSIVPGSVTLVDPPSNGTVVMNTNGTAEYEPDPGFAGTDTFTYTVRDQFNAVSNVATVTVTVESEAPAWQNPGNALDVNNDGVVAPNDVLAVINEINIRGARPLDPPPSDTEPFNPPPYLDVNGDDTLSAIDALLIINYLNGGEPAPVAAMAAEAEDWSWDSESQVVAAALHIEPRRQHVPAGPDPQSVDKVVEAEVSSGPRHLDEVLWGEEDEDWGDWVSTDSDQDKELLLDDWFAEE